MNPDRWREVQRVFDAALELASEEREAFLLKACGSDVQLRAEVDAMLTAERESSGFFDSRGRDALDVLADEVVAPTGTPLAPAGRRVGPYTIVRQIGRGGMGTVYLAQREDVGLNAALKVVAGGLAAPERVDRFLFERRLLARLEHPNIARLLDAGVLEDGTPWLGMEYVEGEPIDEYCDHRKLGIAERLTLFERVCEAVAYAHRHQVVHRDLKPANILVAEGGFPKLLDFGIAKLLEGGKDATTTGVLLLTPEYAAPEQLTGDPVTTATDVYALGLILYQLLCGQRPYRYAGRLPQTDPPRPSAAAMRPVERVEPAQLAAARGTEPEALRRRLMGDLDAIVMRSLAVEPERRYQSAETLLDDLHRHDQGLPVRARPDTRRYRAGKFVQRNRWAVGASAITLALGFLIGLAVLFAWRRPHSGPEEGTGPMRLAVLPFENLGDTATEYFADGITDEVRGKLSALPGMQVIAGRSSAEYKRTTKSLSQIARELGAHYLLVGRIRWDQSAGRPDRVRVSPELIRVEAGVAPTTTWQQPFDASLTDVFQVQAEIAARVASALDLALGDSARHGLAVRPTENLTAYDAYLKGEAASQGMAVTDPATLRGAIVFYQQAVALDSGFVPAWAQLARAQVALYHYGAPIPEVAAQARAAANRAQALRPDRPEGQVALGDYYRSVPADNRRSLAAYEAGLELAPTNADLLVGAGLAEQALGRWEASLQHLRRAGELDPRSANTAQRTARTLLLLRRFPEAQAEVERGFALAPTNLTMTFLRAQVAIGQGNLAGAQAVVRAALPRVDPDALLAFFATFEDLYWVLDDAQQRRLLTLPPRIFDDDRGTWGVVRAQTYWLRNDRARARVYADSAQLAYAEQLRGAPEDAARHVLRGLALAYTGRKAEAIQEGKRAVALLPVSRDANIGTYQQHQLVRIYLLVGEPEKALDQLEPLLRIPSWLSPGRLRIDPSFAPLRGNPRFERLLGRS